MSLASIVDPFKCLTQLSTNEANRFLEGTTDLKDGLRRFFFTPQKQPRELTDLCSLYEANDNALPLHGMKVTFSVVDYVCDITLEQLFMTPPGDQPLEVILKFRQHQATLYGFVIDIDGKKIRGECKEKQSAKDQYDDAIAQGNTAFMASTGSDGVLSVKIGNLPPSSSCLLTLNYLVQLEFRGNDLVVPFPVSALPLSSTTSTTTTTHAIHGFRLEGTIKMSNSSITNIECYSHQIKPTLEEKKASVTSEAHVPGVPMLIFITLDNPHQPLHVLEISGGDKVKGEHEDSAALMVSLFPKIETTDDILSEVIFLVDRSGSMSGTRIEQAKNALQLFLRALPVGTMFNIYGFGSNYDNMFPQSLPFDSSNLSSASAYVAGLSADLGGTELLDPLKHLLALPINTSFPRQIFVLTDGEVSNTTEVLKYVRDNIGKSTRIFSFGVGEPSAALVSGIAKYGNGRAAYVRSGERIEGVVMEQLEMALQPILTDIKVDWGKLPVVERPLPLKSPAIFTGDVLTLFTFLKAVQSLPEKTEIIITGTAGSSPFSWNHSISLEPTYGTTVHRLTANDVISSLEEKSREQQQQDYKDTIVSLSTKWNIASKHTSFVAIAEQDNPSLETLKIIKIEPTTTTSSIDNVSFISAPPTYNLINNYRSLTSCRRLSASYQDEIECNLILNNESNSFSPEISVASSTSSFFDEVGYAFSSVGSSISGFFSSLTSSTPDSASIQTTTTSAIAPVAPSPVTTTTSVISPSPSFASSVAVGGQARPLDVFIVLQDADGSFELSDSFASQLSVALDELIKGLPAFLQNIVVSHRLWATALALAHLQRTFSANKSEWSILAIKMDKYITKHLVENQLKQLLQEEANNFLQNTHSK